MGRRKRGKAPRIVVIVLVPCEDHAVFEESILRGVTRWQTSGGDVWRVCRVDCTELRCTDAVWRKSRRDLV